MFDYNPPSKVYGYTSYSLIPGGENVSVTEENLEEYVKVMSKFLLKDGIEKQLKSFKGKLILKKYFEIQKNCQHLLLLLFM